MEIYFVRHGEPNYELDNLTELGKVQAEKTSIFLNQIDYDLYFASPCGRAKETASYLCNKKGVVPTIVDWANEGVAFQLFGFHNEIYNERRWIFFSPRAMKVLHSLRDDFEWYNHPMFEGYDFKNSIKYYNEEIDKWFESLGIHHDRTSKTYTKIEGEDIPDRVILFAHGGMCYAFLSSVLDLPYSFVATHFTHMDLCGVNKFTVDLEAKTILLNKYNEIHY